MMLKEDSELRKVGNNQKEIDILQITPSSTRGNKMSKYMSIIRWVENGLISALIKTKNSHRLRAYTRIKFIYNFRS
jgi:hypothetical protein